MLNNFKYCNFIYDLILSDECIDSTMMMVSDGKINIFEVESKHFPTVFKKKKIEKNKKKVTEKRKFSRKTNILFYCDNRIEIRFQRVLRIVLDFVLRRLPNLSITCLCGRFCSLIRCGIGFPSSIVVNELLSFEQIIFFKILFRTAHLNKQKCTPGLNTFKYVATNCSFRRFVSSSMAARCCKYLNFSSSLIRANLLLFLFFFGAIRSSGLIKPTYCVTYKGVSRRIRMPVTGNLMTLLGRGADVAMDRIIEHTFQNLKIITDYLITYLIMKLVEDFHAF
ncbi:Uncharacterized protein FWK35_00021319 [Aphis craccivora]|uniref:Uncharacterized protein n=1 Tax=Aphis craccivora TaxID=307492 RepID=A0A6G0VXI0_APHCR|nr:Uncharacterized protein FWK35_00021319 [Aphis craccivora]